MRHSLGQQCHALTPKWLALLVAAVATVVAPIMIMQLSLSDALVAFWLAVGAAVWLLVLDAAWSIALSLAVLSTSKRDGHTCDVRRQYSVEGVVAIPVLLSSLSVVDSALAKVANLASQNQDGDFLFCLVCDLPDGLEQRSTSDALLVEDLRLRFEQRIAAGSERVLLLYRDRSWVQTDGLWSAREKKRGKIEDLVRLMVQGDATAFSLTLGGTERLVGRRHLITLDLDSEMAPGDLGRLVKAMLNLEHSVPGEIAAAPGMRCGVLQPVPHVRIPADASGWQRLHGTACPMLHNAYQDLYGRGSFYGKGIIDAHAHHALLAGRFPENQILSHDLLEGEYLASQITYEVAVTEIHPRTYGAENLRRHRWIRGDWQSSPWLLPTVATAVGNARNSLGALSRFKIAENIVRSLVPPAQLLAVFTGVAAGGGWAWLAFLLAIGAAPLIVPIFARGVVTSRLPDPSSMTGASKALALQALKLMLLPREAVIHVDAIGRALYRMMLTRRKLLEWVPSGDAVGDAGIVGYAKAVGLPAVGASALLAAVAPEGSTGVVLALSCLWLSGPVTCALLDRSCSAAASMEALQ